jgi:hypothetical protein
MAWAFLAHPQHLLIRQYKKIPSSTGLYCVVLHGWQCAIMSIKQIAKETLK